MKKEPVAILTVIAAIIVGFLGRYNITWIDSATVEAGLQVITVVVTGWIARSKVFPENTIREAGLDPELIQERADDPMIPKLEKK
jgi:hypothetical protein